MALALSQHKKLEISRKARARTKMDAYTARSLYDEASIEDIKNDLALNFRVAILGSARLPKDSPPFKHATALTKALVEARGKIDIVTGGGPGIMEAANLGLHRAKIEARLKGKKLRARNHGVLIDLPWEQAANDFVHIETKHPSFSTRLAELFRKTNESYYEEGGFGTLTELGFNLQEVQVGHAKGYKIMAATYWEPMITVIYEHMLKRRKDEGLDPLINPEDIEIIKFTDKIPEIVDNVVVDFDEWKQRRKRIRLVA